MGYGIRFPDSITSYFTDSRGGIESSFVWMQRRLGHVPGQITTKEQRSRHTRLFELVCSDAGVRVPSSQLRAFNLCKAEINLSYAYIRI